jgi:hypothetical protein
VGSLGVQAIHEDPTFCTSRVPTQLAHRHRRSLLVSEEEMESIPCDQINLVYQLYQCNMLVADRISSLFHWSLDALARVFRGIATLVLLTYQTEG